jgi:hypothetical protein
MRNLFLSVIFILSIQTIHAHLPTVRNNAFQRGEKLTYRIHYGFIDAVVATIEILPENKKFGDRNTMHVVGIGKSKGTFDFFFKVRDRYETYIDDQALLPWFFGRRIDEGGFRMAQDYVFNHYKNTVSANGKTVSIKPGTQDMLSGFFLARTYDLGSAREGQIFTVPTIVDGEMYDLKIKFKGREMIKSAWGKIRCLKFVPVLQKGRIFKKEEDMVVWLSDDENHIPIRAKAEILFGSLKVDLLAYKGIMHPFKFQ